MFGIAWREIYVYPPLYNDHSAMQKLLKSGELLEEVKKMVGGQKSCLL